MRQETEYKQTVAELQKVLSEVLGVPKGKIKMYPLDEEGHLIHLCSICKNSRWPKGRERMGKCLASLQNDHCADAWPDGTMKVEARWGRHCVDFERR